MSNQVRPKRRQGAEESGERYCWQNFSSFQLSTSGELRGVKCKARRQYWNCASSVLLCMCVFLTVSGLEIETQKAILIASCCLFFPRFPRPTIPYTRTRPHSPPGCVFVSGITVETSPLDPIKIIFFGCCLVVVTA